MKVNGLIFSSSKEMIYAGTDYGVVTMSTTVSMTDGQYKRHLELYNKYACLEVDPLPQEEQESITNFAKTISGDCRRDRPTISFKKACT
jgi:hypothetical protein